MGNGIDITAIIAYFIALMILLIVGLILFRVFKVPIKILGKLLINSIIGGLALFLLNFVFGLLGFTIAINVFNAVFVGILGIPGLITLIILQFIL